MKATRQLHDFGQSLWLDDISRGILNDGTLQRYIDELSVTGLTSNPTIFDHAITNGDFYDDAIRRKAAEGRSAETLFVELAIIARRTRREYRRVLASPRWRTLAAAGARPQRLLRANTGTKDPDASDTLYVEALAAPDTINTMPEKTLTAFADHGRADGGLPLDASDTEGMLAEFNRAGVAQAALAARLQSEGAASFDKSWRDLLERLAAKRTALTQPGPVTADGS